MMRRLTKQIYIYIYTSNHIIIPKEYPEKKRVMVHVDTRLNYVFWGLCVHDEKTKNKM